MPADRRSRIRGIPIMRYPLHAQWMGFGLWTNEMSENILEVRGLRTAFHTEAGAWLAVDGVDLTVRRGEIVGLVGESGSGKSVTGFSLLGLIDPPGEVVDGEVKFKGTDLRKLSEEQMRQLRGNRIAMIFQDPLMTLNPVLRIGEQMMEAILTHEDVPRAQAEERCREALAMVGSSQMIRSGLFSMAIAIATRWRMPPENSCG